MKIKRMCFDNIKFGTGGFRAIIGESFTKENVQLLAQGLCNLIKKENGIKQMVVGYDRRFMSDQFAYWFCEVLAGNDVKAILSDSQVPTPLVMLATKDFGNTFGAMITASHNPYIYNGIKIFTEGGKDGDIEFTAKLEKEVKSINDIFVTEFNEGLTNGLIEKLNYMDKYINAIKSNLKPVTRPNTNKILFNVMNGVTGEPMQKLSEVLQLTNLTMERKDRDAFFNFRLPSPNENTLKDFAKRVIDEKFDFALACDADGDRVALIDDKGTIYNGNAIIAIIYYYLIKYCHKTGDLVINVASSTMLKNLAKELHTTCHEVPVGFKWLSTKMLETNAILCGESSGGLTIKDYILGKDSMIACALLIEAQREINMPFSKIIENIYKMTNYNKVFVEKTFVVSNRDAFNKYLYSNEPNLFEKIVNSRNDDGRKFYLADESWAMIRFSGNEPILRLFVEATPEKSQKLMNSIIDFTIIGDPTAHEIIQ